MDPQEYRRSSRDQWEAVARGWGDRRDVFQRAAEPVSRWMVDAIDPQPGQTILELAAGPGDTGFLAAALIGPEGRLISTDGAEAMVEVARERAAELGIANAEFKAMEAEWIDLGAASVDAVLCRWGYMLLADPEAALRETRRVLRPEGVVAFAAWDAAALNPWISLSGSVASELGIGAPGPAGGPGPFALADRALIDELLEASGFSGWTIEGVDFHFDVPDFDTWWDAQYDMSAGLTRILSEATPEQRDELYEGMEARAAQYRAADGSLRIPARTHVAVAEA